MSVAGTTFLMLVDGAKRAGLVGCSGIYWSKLHLNIIFFKVEYLVAYVHILFFSTGNIFYFAVMILPCFPPTGSHSLMNMAKLGLFFS